METLVGLYLIFGLLVLVVIVLWTLLPFAVFGTKPLLTQILAELRAIRAAVEASEQRMGRTGTGT